MHGTLDWWHGIRWVFAIKYTIWQLNREYLLNRSVQMIFSSLLLFFLCASALVWWPFFRSSVLIAMWEKLGRIKLLSPNRGDFAMCIENVFFIALAKHTHIFVNSTNRIGNFHLHFRIPILGVAILTSFFLFFFCRMA